ncbi:C45 family peptidase [Sulfitobacter sp. S190]|nr:C45 family peptidase [Sulfitobacter sp. S190]
MSLSTLTFDAVDECLPGQKWLARWNRSWPAYEAWFTARGGDMGPSRSESEAALKRHMPELYPIYVKLLRLAGGTDRAARFLTTWCPPCYLGGCSIAASATKSEVRLVRNYDLSPELNEGLLLRSEWNGRPVMGMIEFLWGVSDGINEAGLSVALAYGGRSETATGFGITTILRYVLETCDTVSQALSVLGRVPSHMAYNVVLADAEGHTASVELTPGGGCKRMRKAIATNHQSGPKMAERPEFTRSFERLSHLDQLDVPPEELCAQFLDAPLLQHRYSEGFGTLFTAEYDPKRRSLALTMAGVHWTQKLGDFREGQETIRYAAERAVTADQPDGQRPKWSMAGLIDWSEVATDYASGCGKEIWQYLPSSDRTAQQPGKKTMEMVE